jgi:16S rRNA processing protein RimM
LPSRTNPRPTSPEPHEGFVAVGSIRGPRGLEGELKVEPLSDNPQRFVPGATLRAGDRSYTIRAARMHQRALLLRLEGVATREQADELRGLLLEVPESELAALGEDEYYRFQLVGLEVRDEEGRVLGRLKRCSIPARTMSTSCERTSSCSSRDRAGRSECRPAGA